jgi:hypothetical protein
MCYTILLPRGVLLCCFHRVVALYYILPCCRCKIRSSRIDGDNIYQKSHGEIILGNEYKTVGAVAATDTKDLIPILLIVRLPGAHTTPEG